MIVEIGDERLRRIRWMDGWIDGWMVGSFYG